MFLSTTSQCMPCIVTLPSSKVIAAKDIVNKACDFFSIPKQKLFSKSRKSELVTTRQMIIYILCTHTIYKLVYIATLVGFKDHTTVIHNRDKAKSRIANDINYRNEYNSLYSFIFTD